MHDGMLETDLFGNTMYIGYNRPLFDKYKTISLATWVIKYKASQQIPIELFVSQEII